MKRLIMLLAGLTFFAGVSSALPMRFTWHAPCSDSDSDCGAYILAQGEITEATPGDFGRFFQATRHAGATVYFDSRGGDVIAGVKLGRLIHKFGLDTYVGGPYEEQLVHTGKALTLVKDAECLSACVYAFAGGRTRTYSNRGDLGVHQFFGVGKQDAGMAQMVMVSLANYLDEMGVDRKLLDLAAVYQPTEIAHVSVSEARQWRLDNSSAPEGQWKLEADSDGGLILAASQSRAKGTGMARIQLWRSGLQIGVQVVYTPNQSSRSSQELDEAYADPEASGEFMIGEIEPSERPAGDRPVDYPVGTEPGDRTGTPVGQRAKGPTKWTHLNDQDGQSYKTEFLVPATLLQSLSRGHTFGIKWKFPNAWEDIDPSMVFGTSGLEVGIRALILNTKGNASAASSPRHDSSPIHWRLAELVVLPSSPAVQKKPKRRQRADL